MLDVIRRRQKTVVVKIVFWVIIATFIGTIFLVWGKGGDQSREISVAAQVNDTDISFDDFKSTYSNIYNFYKQMYGQSFTPELEEQIGLSQQAINSLIDQTLLLQEAERLNLKVTKDDIVQAIAAVPAFQEEGSFSKERYLNVLAYQRMKPELFEQIQRRQMLISMAREQLYSTINVTAEDVVAEYRRINEKINLEYVPFAASSFAGQVELDEAQVADYYAEHKESWRVPEQIDLSFVVLDPRAYSEQISFTDADVEQYYNRHLIEYDVPEQASVAHILINVSATADEKELAEKKQLAEDILAKAQSGDFAALAKKYSQDKRTANSGGDLGYFERGTMDSDFENAAFALPVGSVSMVKSNAGYHVIKGLGHIEAGFKSLREVEAEVRQGLSQELSERMAYEKAMDAYNLNRKDGSLVAAGQSLQAPISTTGLFARGEAIPAIGQNDEFSQQVFTMNSGQLIAPVKTSHGIYLCEVADKKASYVPEFDQVRSQVEEAVRNIEAVKLAQQGADKALQDSLAGAAMKTLVPQGAQLGETGMFGRAMGGFVPTLGNIDGLSEAAFALTIKNPIADKVFASADTFYIVRLKQLHPADPTALSAEESEKLRSSVLRTKQDQILKDKLAQLRADAEVVISPAILRSIEGKK
ncbi:MAG: SurA N-terminal domain-containing protein [Desulfuromonas sp.]|nr:SurA N-terminal domain-containing protein [Desulfuromonas sp.]